MTAPLQGNVAHARICIDFGTAFSKAAIFHTGAAPARERVRALEIGLAAGADHPLLAPSFLFVGDGRILIGPPALERARGPGHEHRDPIMSFKTVLAARDLAPALALKVRPSVDPTGTLRHRDALVLYLAYLDRLVGRALTAQDAAQAQDLMSAPRRYTSPIWRARGAADTLMARLFDEAAFISSRLGDTLLSAEGISIAQARDALAKASDAPTQNRLEASVFEAHAAGAAYTAFARNAKPFALVVDMGAGTTDLAGFALESDQSPPVLAEIIGARQSCGLAGDQIDEIIIAALAARAGKQESNPALWRALKLNARRLKRDLFELGKCQYDFSGKKLSLRREDLAKLPAFKEFAHALAAIVAASIRAVASAARTTPSAKLNILLAGGGANLSAVHDIARAAAASVGSGLDLVIERFGDDWFLPSGFDPALRSAFPQVAIALGGALVELIDTPQDETKSSAA